MTTLAKPVVNSTKPGKLFSPSRLIFYVFALLVFYFALHYIGKLKDIRDLMLQMSPVWLFLTLGAQIATYILSAFILKGLIRSHPGSADLRSLFKMSIVIMFVNQALPTGGISGNGYLFKQLTRRRVPRHTAFTALVLQTIGFYFAIMLLLAVFYSWYLIFEVHVAAMINYVVLLGFVFYSALTCLVLLLYNRSTVLFILRKLSRYNWIKRYLRKAGLLSLQSESERSFQMLFNNRKVLLNTVVFQLVIIFCDVLTVYALVQGFHIPMSFGLVTFALLLSLVIGALPISPGSLIVYESAMTYFFTKLGAPVHAALIITLLYRFFTFWLPIPVGLIFYRNLERSGEPRPAVTKQP